MRALVSADHIPKNLYQLKITSPAAVVNAIEIGGFELEIDTAELPDRTRVKGGRVKPFEFDIRVPAHNDVDIAYMDTWFNLSADSKSPTALYKRTATLDIAKISTVIKSYSLVGVFVTKRMSDDLALDNEAEMSTVVYTLSVDVAKYNNNALDYDNVL